MLLRIFGELPPCACSPRCPNRTAARVTSTTWLLLSGGLFEHPSANGTQRTSRPCFFPCVNNSKWVKGTRSPQTSAAVSDTPDLIYGLFAACILQVLRRPTYKGHVQSAVSLPVDGTTVLGAVLVLACVLPTATLTGDAVQSCWRVLQCLEAHMQLNVSLQLLPHEPVFSLKLENGMALTSDLKKILREIELPWCRLLYLCLPGIRIVLHMLIFLLVTESHCPSINHALIATDPCPRFARKLPKSVDRSMPFSAILIALLRLRSDSVCWQSLPFRRLCKRSLHLFCQHASRMLGSKITSECPLPDIAAKYHPYMKTSRMRGNKCLEMSLIQKFMTRGGGFVSAKQETMLSDLGLVKHRTAFANKTSTEFVARNLLRTAEYVSSVIERQSLKTVNICFDTARVCHEDVPLLLRL